MSDGTVQEREEQELQEMKEKIQQLSEVEKAKAEETPHPEPQQTPAIPETPAPVAPVVSEVKTDDKDPMEWAKTKGFKSPEDMARALLKKEQDYHAEQQQKAKQPPAPELNQWQPRPEMGYQYPAYPAYQAPAAPNQNMVRQVAAMYPQIDPADVERVLPMIFDVAKVVSKQEREAFQKEIGEIKRTTNRNNELMKLMQDPMFHDNRVQREVHAVLDSDPSIFQRVDEPLAHAFEKALVNLARKQLQQGSSEKENLPPVTAGGGNGSAFTVPKAVTEREFDSWSSEDQAAYINSKGRILPKNRR